MKEFDFFSIERNKEHSLIHFSNSYMRLLRLMTKDPQRMTRKASL